MKELVLVSWILYPVLEAIIQDTLMEDEWKPNYLQLFVIRGIFSIVHGAFMDVEPYPWYEFPLLIIFQACTFWVVFDLLLNWLRGKPLTYRGATSGWLDRLLPSWIYWPAKVLAVPTAILIAIFYAF